MKTLYKPQSHLQSFWSTLFAIFFRVSILFCLLLIFNLNSCKKEDVGTCTIRIHGGGENVYDDISLEECQNIFGNTVGARGWEWDPNR